MTSHVLKSVNLGIGGSQNVNLYLKNYSEACRINKLQYSLLKQWKLAFHQIFSPPLQFLESLCWLADENELWSDENENL